MPVELTAGQPFHRIDFRLLPRPVKYFLPGPDFIFRHFLANIHTFFEKLYDLPVNTIYLIPQFL